MKSYEQALNDIANDMREIFTCDLYSNNELHTRRYGIADALSSIYGVDWEQARKDVANIIFEH